MYSFEEVASVTRKGQTFWSCGVSDAKKITDFLLQKTEGR
jgi:hypothetical protein